MRFFIPPICNIRPKAFRLICLISLFFVYTSPLYSFNYGISNADIDIGVFSEGCSGFVVKVKPTYSISSDLTNLQFTIKWPENTVDMSNFDSDFGLTQQGPVITEGGFNYIVLVSVPTVSMPVNWLAGEEYTVLTFEHNQAGTDPIDVFIAQDTWANQNNGSYYIEMLGLDNTGTVYHQALNVFSGLCIDIGLFNVSCTGFEVRLKPGADVNSDLTNLQFTIKWPENTLSFSNFQSDYGLLQQGPLFIADGFNYAVFAVVPLSSPVNWLAGEEQVVLSFDHDQSWTGTLDLLIAQDVWAAQNNGFYYVEMLGTDFSGDVYNEELGLTVGPCCLAYLKAILQGAYDASATEMRTSINAAGNLPLTQPYNASPWNYTGTEEVSTFPDSIVDWVLIKLLDNSDPAILVEQRAALISKSGQVLDTDLTQGISFTSVPGDYYLVVDHRNHMPVMTASPITLPNDLDPYDFREVVETQPYLHNDPLPAILELPPLGSGIYGMIAGDVNADDVLKYLGVDDDRGLILSVIISVTGSNSINGSILGYHIEDVSLDNKVLYLGLGDDRGIILQNIISLTSSNQINGIYYSVVP